MLNSKIILPYTIQSCNILSVAPSIRDISFKNTIPTMLRTIPSAIANQINIEKYSFAKLFFFSPKVLDTSALPPVPIINPNPPTINKNGIMIFIAANEVFPTKLDTKSPSTTT
ncbi:Uncharacterised protein [Chlamydia trachomatis]|nr:Uncharacterised protein [Chlamydia trachomatis]